MALACCLFGAIVGDSIMYWIGYHFGRGVLAEHPWWARWVTPEREAQIEEKFRQHGFKVFFVARFLVGLRSPVYLTAGILRVSFRRFFLIDLFCATAVVSTFFGLTYLFGQFIPQPDSQSRDRADGCGGDCAGVRCVLPLAAVSSEIRRPEEAAPKGRGSHLGPGQSAQSMQTPADEASDDKAPDDKAPRQQGEANGEMRKVAGTRRVPTTMRAKS